jgi:hypothetical protein
VDQNASIPDPFMPPRLIDIVEGAVPGAGAADPSAGGKGGGDGSGRPWLSVFFRCANQYTRVYRERDGQSYRPVCPKCGQSMRIGVAPGGSEKRLFELSC